MTTKRATPDPLTLYPRPPFAPQQQPNPGFTQQMDPVPDHGEESYVGHGRLEGLRALITGADSGIGRAVTIAFAREGADIALNYLEAEQKEAEVSAGHVRDAGREAVLLPADIGDEDACRTMVADAVEKLGGLDLVVMIAGTQRTVDSIRELDTSVLDMIMRTNVYSLFWITNAAIDHLKPGAAIITTSSIQAFDPSPQIVEYATSKGAIANWTRAMAKQLAESGIRVNGVAPGPFWTPLQPSTSPPEKIESFGDQVPYGRPGQPAELASSYVYLADPATSYTSGETIIVNGGQSGH